MELVYFTLEKYFVRQL